MFAFVCVYVYVCRNVCMFMYACVYVCMDVCVCVCVCMCMYVYACMWVSGILGDIFSSYIFSIYVFVLFRNFTSIFFLRP